MVPSPEEKNPSDAEEQDTSFNGEASDTVSTPDEASDEATHALPTVSSDENLEDDLEGENNEEEDADPLPLTFEGDAIDEKLGHSNNDDLNRADFGIIKIDDEGEILFFNTYESELSGVAPDDAVGKNFFTQVAPCTNNRLFRGRFKKGVRKNKLDATFTYTYTYRMRPTLVTIHLYRDSRDDNWIMVQKF